MKKGDKVRITDRFHDLCGWNTDIDCMIGKVYEVEQVDNTPSGEVCHVGGYRFYSHDLDFAESGFAVGDRVKVTRKFKTGDHGPLSWEPEMDIFVGKTGTITDISDLGNCRVDVAECSGFWYFHPSVLEHVKPSRVARILFEKKMINGIPCREITGFENISRREALPEKYVSGKPSFWFGVMFHGNHYFNGEIMTWKTSEYRDTLTIKLPEDAHIDCGMFSFAGITVGDIWPETTYQELLTWLRRAGSRLAKIRKQEKEAWSGSGVDEI